MQNLAWAVTLALMLVVTGMFWWFASCATQTAIVDGAAGAAYRWRSRTFWLLIVAGAAISFATLHAWPIKGHASRPAQPDVVINAVGHQFSWQLDRTDVRVGQLIEFRLTSDDVNHGFAIYKNKTHLLAQTQAMPGYINKLKYRFEAPGNYEILCLEYCGVGHHAMRAVIEVSNGD